MRRMAMGMLAACLAALVWARAGLRPPEAEALEPEQELSVCNTLAPERPPVTETAGSGAVGEMNAYYFDRPATEKTACTGSLAGKNLVLICADDWAAGAPEPESALAAMETEGAVFETVYRPDWYQGMDGRLFALLTGVVPTSVDGRTALSWLDRQDVYLPFTLARALGDAGYVCRACLPDGTHRAAFESLGFSHIRIWQGAAAELTAATAEECLSETPFFVFYLWDGDGAAALETLFAALSERDMLEDTAVCLLTAGDGERRAGLYLRGGGLAGVTVSEPCSELDVTPTLLNLFGADYDARFLSGRDMLAPVPAAETAEGPLCLVSLYGSAYSDWATPAGTCVDGVFRPSAGTFSSAREADAYARTVSGLVYDRYIYARRAMETNYFQLVFG